MKLFVVPLLQRNRKRAEQQPFGEDEIYIDHDAAKRKAKRMNALLSAGEKKALGLRYKVLELEQAKKMGFTVK